jgi:hydrogenase maturation protein HypF
MMPTIDPWSNCFKNECAARARERRVWREAITFDVSVPLARAVLAVGSELKNTVCVGAGTALTVSEPHGDLTEAANYRRFVETVRLLRDGCGERSHVVAHDMHPIYLSTVLARELADVTVPVQHHHAHAISCAVDAGVELPVIAVVCDGTGYGADGATWGGEVLWCEASSFRRMAHLAYFPVPGGDAAAKATWRSALAVLRAALPDAWRTVPLLGSQRSQSGGPPGVDPRERELVMRQLDAGLNTPATSSMGRMFDAAACLAGVCTRNEYQGQAPIELEAAADGRMGEPYPFAIEDTVQPARIDWRSMIREIVEDVRSGAAAGAVSSRFHATAVAMFAEAATRAAAASGVNRVVLSGGCLFNKLLRTGLIETLRDRGMEVAVHRRLAPGDAALSLGQAVIGAAVAAGRGD